MQKFDCICILLASGSGKRFGANVPKQFYQVNDKPLLYYSLNMLNNEKNMKIILCANPKFINETKDIVNKYKFQNISVIPGGKERNFSIENAFNYIKSRFTSNTVIIHDHNRVLINNYDITCLKDNAIKFGFCAFKLPLTYCIGQVDASGFLIDSPHRNKYVETHNPCGMKYGLFIKMYTNLSVNDRNKLYSDHILFSKKLGTKPKLVNGNRMRLTKITYKNDIDTIINYLPK